MKVLIDCEQPSSHYLCPFNKKKLILSIQAFYPCRLDELEHTTQGRAQKHRKTIIRLETNRTVKLTVSAWVGHGSIVLPPAEENAIFAIRFGGNVEICTQKDLIAGDIFKTLYL